MKRRPGAEGSPWGKAGGEGGFALVLTVWLLAILAVIGGEFIFSSRLRLRAEYSMREESQSYALAVAGYQAALDMLGEGLSGLSLDDDGNLLLHLKGRDGEVPAELRDEPLGTGTYSFRIEDEDGKIDINRQRRTVLVSLLREAGHVPGQERDTIVDSILDWVDSNREHRINGAEEDYYRGLDPPYSCKDGPLDVEEELLLVRGMREEYLFGGEEGEMSYLPLREFVTVYPASFNPATAREEVLKALRRKRPAATSPSRPSEYYSISAAGQAREEGLQRAVRAVVKRESGGGKITFRLLYWNDNYFPKGARDAVD